MYISRATAAMNVAGQCTAASAITRMLHDTIDSIVWRGASKWCGAESCKEDRPHMGKALEARWDMTLRESSAGILLRLFCCS